MTSVVARPSAVVDTNRWVSGLISSRGLPYQLINAMHAGAFTLILSSPLREEYVRVLARPRFVDVLGVTRSRVAALLRVIDASARMVTPAVDLPVTVRDPKDEIVLATALAGPADYLVTGDDDLLTLRDHPALGTLRIVTAREFLAILPPA